MLNKKSEVKRAASGAKYNWSEQGTMNKMDGGCGENVS